jgi:putative restriction endonuclease
MPLIWFYGISEGLYQPIYPVWLAADEPARLQVVVALEESQLILDSMPLNTVDRRRYAERVTRQRLHQPAFRAQVLLAYRSQCAICRLRHESLLDAAHITPDREVRGLPLVSNGMALCKIHHAAYDKHIIGIRPDRIVEVRTDVLREIDGPMLQHGLQDMHNVRLTVPDSPRLRPNRQALEERYAIFRSATV